MTSIKSRLGHKHILHFCIFATGVAGIVSEYVLSTLASYLLGNTIIQWTITISFMLFAMGIGSRMTRFVERRLADVFIAAEFSLSLLVAIAAPVSYIFAATPELRSIIIYSFTISIGLLIGMELPLVARMNSKYEDLAMNISNVMEMDYIGALLGGVFFALVGLPYLGLTYTPIVLAVLNYLVAVVFWFMFRAETSRAWGYAASILAVGFIALFIFVKPFMIWGEQKRYKDLVVYEEQSAYQKIIVTKWHDDFWLYLNSHEQFSSYDEVRYHEPFVHPPMLAAEGNPEDILILGGGDGMAAREVLKYSFVRTLTVVDLDPAVTDLARTDPAFVAQNKGSLDDPRVTVINADGYKYLAETGRLWDVIMIDLTDPRSPDVERLYTVQFYRIAAAHLKPGGVVSTQATSPIYSKQAYWCIYKTIGATGLAQYGWHTQIPTMGEWGWVMGVKDHERMDADLFSEKLASELKTRMPDTKFLSTAVMKSMFVFSDLDKIDLDTIQVHTEFDPVLRKYYNKGDWALF